jgi:phosphomannomutase
VTAALPLIRFGTDGWRGVIADDFTFANVARAAQAAADYWNASRPEGTDPRVVVGYDRRFLSDAFARCAAGVFSANGLQVVLSPVPAPTPAVSFAVKRHRAAGGVMITASHNPPEFNGFKLKAWYGGSANPQICSGVESWLDRRPVQARPFAEGLRDKTVRLRRLHTEYFSAIRRLVNFDLISRARFRVAHEALFGVGARCFETLLAGTRCQITTLNAAHDPLFGGLKPEPVAQNYRGSVDFLRKHPHDVCLVTDGDADRLGGLDEQGRPLTTHQIICLLLRHMILNRQGRGRIVKSLNTTAMVDKMCAAYGLDLLETGVGFKFICDEMAKGGVLMGVEESGGIGFAEHLPERDGILAGLMLLELLAVERTPLSHLVNRLETEYGRHCYGRIDLRFPLERCAELMEFCLANPPSSLAGSPIVALTSFDGVKYTARNTSWLMVRGSGTEPVLRVYAEAETQAVVRRLLNLGLRLTRQV